MKLLRLSKRDLALAKAEAESLHGAQGELRADYLRLNVAHVRNGLAFTKEAYEVLAECAPEQLAQTAANLQWLEVEMPFKVVCRGSLPAADELAGHVWRALAARGVAPIVSLENPASTITFLSLDGTVSICLLERRNDERFEERRSHLRPANHPTGLQPRLARAMINLTGGAREILDPFCGAGGILIEGLLAGRAMRGIDIDQRQVARCQQNIAAFSLEADIRVGDATVIGDRADAIVTDLPLGRNARVVGDLKDFLGVAARVAPIMVLGTGAPLEHPAWQTHQSFTWPLHKGLAKHIQIMRRAA